MIKFGIKFGNKLSYRLRLQLHSIFLLDVNFDKSIIELYFFFSYILYTCKILKISKINSYVINQMKCLNFEFLLSKIKHKK